MKLNALMKYLQQKKIGPDIDGLFVKKTYNHSRRLFCEVQ